MGRKCGHSIRVDGRAIRKAEKQCEEMCDSGSELCGKCLDLQVKYMMGDKKVSYHGIMGGPIPEESHIIGGPWNIKTAAKEIAKLSKTAAVAETIAEDAEETSEKAMTVAKGATAAAKKAEKAAEKAAKEAEKAAAKAAKEAAKKAAKVAAADLKEHMATLGGAANVYAGLAPRKRRATTAKKAAARKSSSSSSHRSTSRRRTTTGRRRSSSQIGNPFAAGAPVPPNYQMIYKPVSKAAAASPSSNSAYVPRNLSGDGGRIPSYRGASPNERSEETRAGIQDRILADMMEAQMARAM